MWEVLTWVMESACFVTDLLGCRDQPVKNTAERGSLPRSIVVVMLVTNRYSTVNVQYNYIKVFFTSWWYAAQQGS